MDELVSGAGADTSVRVPFEAFVVAQGDRLLRTAYLLTRDHALAEDLLQTALTQAWTAWRRIESQPEPSEIDGHADRTDLWTALGRLPRRQRAAVVLRYYEGLTEPETAAVLGCSVCTVKSQTSRALAKLRIDPALAETWTEGTGR